MKRRILPILASLCMVAPLAWGAPIAQGNIPAPSGPLGCLIEPDKVADLGSPVVGVVDGVRAERGDSVRQGQVLAVLRNDVERASAEVARTRASTEAELRSAEASRDVAQQKWRRAEELLAKNFIAQQALDQAKGDFQVAEQKVRQVREQLKVWSREAGVADAQVGLRTIRSPFDGVVVERYLSRGERVEEKPVFRVAKIDPLRVELIVPALRFGTLNVGETLSVKPDLPHLPAMDATVSVVDRVVDAASNTFRVRLSLPNPQGRIPAGLRCRVSLPEQGAAVTKAASDGRLIGGMRMDSTLTSLKEAKRR